VKSTLFRSAEVRPSHHSPNSSENSTSHSINNYAIDDIMSSTTSGRLQTPLPATADVAVAVGFQPAFSGGEGLRTAPKSRLKSGCGQNCLIYNPLGKSKSHPDSFLSRALEKQAFHSRDYLIGVFSSLTGAFSGGMWFIAMGAGVSAVLALLGRQRPGRK